MIRGGGRRVRSVALLHQAIIALRSSRCSPWSGVSVRERHDAGGRRAAEGRPRGRPSRPGTGAADRFRPAVAARRLLRPSRAWPQALPGPGHRSPPRSAGSPVLGQHLLNGRDRLVYHPIQAGAAAVWIPGGIGLWLLAARAGISAGWPGCQRGLGLVVWVFGEAFADLRSRPDLAVRCPGAALVYVVAGGPAGPADRAGGRRGWAVPCWPASGCS